MQKVLVSVSGKDTTGIIAAIATALSQMSINILEINQTILDGYFTMMMVVDMGSAKQDFQMVYDELMNVGGALHMTIHMQRMDIFDAMHRI